MNHRIVIIEKTSTGEEKEKTYTIEATLPLEKQEYIKSNKLGFTEIFIRKGIQLITATELFEIYYILPPPSLDDIPASIIQEENQICGRVFFPSMPADQNILVERKGKGFIDSGYGRECLAEIRRLLITEDQKHDLIAVSKSLKTPKTKITGRNIFRQIEGNLWQFRYDGSAITTSNKDLAGYVYIRELLTSGSAKRYSPRALLGEKAMPLPSMNADNLEDNTQNRIESAGLTDKYDESGKLEERDYEITPDPSSLTDLEAIKCIKKEINERNDKIKSLELDDLKQKTNKHEIAQLKNHLKKLETTPTMTENDRQRVKNNLNTAYNEIKKLLPKLADYLKKDAIKFLNNEYYSINTGDWDTG